jgi:type II secretory pathway component GspD/PulD (secretin)
VNRNGLITVRIRPEVSSILGKEQTQGFPHVRTREADLVATVRDGETIAIAGLIQREEIESILKLPILGDIPLLGLLFQNKKLDTKETEMVIFVTPRIVEVDEENLRPNYVDDEHNMYLEESEYDGEKEISCASRGVFPCGY